jgi:ABC-type polysaccharide/polyol phosphate transport system ATPase subunit
LTPALSLQGVSKRYRVFQNGRDRLKETLSFGRKKYGHDFWALKDVSLEVEPGTTLGILGRNGAGKSTLLSIASGILPPSEGTVEVNGRLIALFALGAGFNSEFTGRENIMLNGLILGIERQEILDRFDDIADFADIGEFIDQPIKTYSSGMRSKLGFAVAVNVKPDILILDETLAVGDAVYKQVALQKMYELRDSGTTILFVSHSTRTVEQFCNKAILLDKGRLLATGETGEVAERYQELVQDAQKKGSKRLGRGPTPAGFLAHDGEAQALEKISKSEGHLAHPGDPGTGGTKIRGVEVLDESLLPAKKVAPDSTVTVRVHLEYLEAVKDSEVVVTLRNKAGLEVFSTSTARDGVPLKEMEKGERVTVDFAFKVPLHHGPYNVTVAARAGDEDTYQDLAEEAAVFRISRPEDGEPFEGLVHLPTEIRVHDAPEEERQGRSA